MMNTSNTFLLTILCLFPTFSAQVFPQDEGSTCTGYKGEKEEDLYSHRCGALNYSILESSCCDVNITQGLSQLVADCCKSEAYNPLNQICCDGHIMTRNSVQNRCCGKEIYVMATHLCCGATVIPRNNENRACCGSQSFNKATECCCPNELAVKPIQDSCCPKPSTVKSPPKNISSGESTDSKRKNSNGSKCNPGSKLTGSMSNTVQNCGSETYNSQMCVCCSGKLFSRGSGLNKCCGEDVYSLSDNSVLCCNGSLHLNVSEDSECVGGVLYTTANRTSFSQISCGSKVYNPHNTTLRCCSGHLYDTTHCDPKAECCGTLLVKNKTTHTCCSSASQTLLYKTLPNHSCCGHYYYNTSLWSCCAERLKPTPEKHISPAHRLKPLMDLIPDICNKSVLFGKVEHLVLQKDRQIMLREVDVKLGKPIEGSLLPVFLDHCRFPALENGMTYLWEKNDTEYKPLSVPIDLISDMRMFITVCKNYVTNSTMGNEVK